MGRKLTLYGAKERNFTLRTLATKRLPHVCKTRECEDEF
jgi:hypothetical protein